MPKLIILELAPDFQGQADILYVEDVDHATRLLADDLSCTASADWAAVVWDEWHAKKGIGEFSVNHHDIDVSWTFTYLP